MSGGWIPYSPCATGRSISPAKRLPTGSSGPLLILSPQKTSKSYNSLKYTLSILDGVYVFIWLLAGMFLGLPRITAGWLRTWTSPWAALPLFLLILSLAYLIISLPLTFYRSYIIEHRFSLTKQTLPEWFKDYFKSAGISYLLFLVLFTVFYIVVRQSPQAWWLYVSAAWLVLSIFFARLFPILVIPLFFKCKPLADKVLHERITNLAARMKVRIADVFEIDFSKKTLKANAAFVGWGKTRRVLLADTLLNSFTLDEIEVVLAHEFAHYSLRHIFKLLIMISVSTLATFYFMFRTSGAAVEFFGMASLLDLGALPVVLMYFMVIGAILGPWEHFISRCFERSADALALKVTGLRDAFISTMDKLADKNLADRRPHPLIKFFFFDHPPIDERIEMARLANLA